MPTVAQLEKLLRQTVDAGRVTIHAKSLPLRKRRYAQIHLDKKPHRIEIDFEACALHALIHELLHSAGDRAYSKWGSLEEPTIEAHALEIADHINARPKLWKLWRRILGDANAED